LLLPLLLQQAPTSLPVPAMERRDPIKQHPVTRTLIDVA